MSEEMSNLEKGEINQQKRGEMRNTKPEKHSQEFYYCGFCNCHTNAHLRRCCDEGYQDDLKHSSSRKDGEG